MTKKDGIFTTETEILQHATSILIQKNIEQDELMNEYENLVSSYNKLLRQTKKLISMADSSQKKLLETNELVKEKVVQLTNAEMNLKKLATTDSLTGLLNRRGININIENLIIRTKRNNTPFSIFLIDIDHFKLVNDKYGHHTGDFVLKKLSKTLQKLLRAQDFIARWGGEEFLLILPHTENKGALTIAEKMRAKIEKTHFKFDNKSIKITISLGGCCFYNGMAFNFCLDIADKELYKSKLDGRNRVNLYGY